MYIHYGDQSQVTSLMKSGFRQYITEYTVANFLRCPIRRRVIFSSALEWKLLYVRVQKCSLVNSYNYIIDGIAPGKQEVYCKQARTYEYGTYLIQSGVQHKMSRIMRKTAFCICKNKSADQLHGFQHLPFRYISRLPKSEISSL